MDILPFKSKTVVTFLFTAISLVALLTACADKSASKPVGALKNTDYCKSYKKFESTVATDSLEQQRKALEKIIETKDFPTSPSSLREDYEFLIEGYKKVANNTYDIGEQEKYKAATKRIQRHAIDNCDILVSNSDSENAK